MLSIRNTYMLWIAMLLCFSNVSSMAQQTDGRSGTYVLARNEDSTPRNSVLPSSPAILPKSETGSAIAPQTTIKFVKAQLLQLGYSVGSLDGSVTASFKAALFEFQKAHGISADGKLSEQTLRLLGVYSK